MTDKTKRNLARCWTVGEWTFYEVDTGQPEVVVPLFGYATGPVTSKIKGGPAIGELYSSLEHAMAAAIAEKYTGRRGAGGTGVGTAADWFIRMIGADQPTRRELIERAAEGPRVIGIAEDAGSGGYAVGVAGAVVDALGLGRKTWNGRSLVTEP